MKFVYGPMDRRVAKIVYNNDAHSDVVYTYYTYDATGNVLATYERLQNLSSDAYTLEEFHVYGASRLGTAIQGKRLAIRDLTFVGTSSDVETATDMQWSSPTYNTYDKTFRLVGQKYYELSNLPIGIGMGNVLAVVTDKKIPLTTTTYTADVVRYSDYSPYGVQLDNRHGGTGYRYGFQGYEADNEVKGEGNSYTTEFRQFDSRLGRWLSVDPRSEKYVSFSPYISYGNNPVLIVDNDGDTTRVSTKDGKFLFDLDDGKQEITKLTAKELYDKGIQWFEPLADNYYKLIKKADNLSKMSELKHFKWSEIIDFVDEDLWMSQYVQGGKGDWKVQKDGADGYLLVTVDGEPYWADAVGQIPFAVDAYTDFYEQKKDQKAAIYSTVYTGEKYGSGKLMGDPDFSNSYDTYMILRGALWAAYNHALINGDAERTYPTDYTKLSTPISKLYRDLYLGNLKR